MNDIVTWYKLRNNSDKIFRKVIKIIISCLPKPIT